MDSAGMRNWQMVVQRQIIAYRDVWGHFISTAMTKIPLNCGEVGLYGRNSLGVSGLEYVVTPGAYVAPDKR